MYQKKSRDRDAITVTINSVPTVIKRLNPIIVKGAQTQMLLGPGLDTINSSSRNSYRLRLGRERFSKLPYDYDYD